MEHDLGSILAENVVSVACSLSFLAIEDRDGDVDANRSPISEHRPTPCQAISLMYTGLQDRPAKMDAASRIHGSRTSSKTLMPFIDMLNMRKAFRLPFTGLPHRSCRSLL